MQREPNAPDNDRRSQPGLGFVDGFRFGCGFSVAAAAAMLLALLALAVLMLVLSLAGVSLLDSLLAARQALQLPLVS